MSVIVDTSVWIDHLHQVDQRIIHLLSHGEVLLHPFVLGELSCGNIRNRPAVLTTLRDLTRAPLAGDDEALALIERRSLHGRGLAYTDVHLLASALLVGATVWSRDRALISAAAALGVCA